jgi:hypothetical protein
MSSEVERQKLSLRSAHPFNRGQLPVPFAGA